jgi:hypothetical protein
MGSRHEGTTEHYPGKGQLLREIVSREKLLDDW